MNKIIHFLVTNRKLFPALLINSFTGSGVIFSFFALISIINGSEFRTFIFLTIALVIDTIDGTLARKYKTSKILPQIDGKTLDTIIDYLNFIFIPSIMLYKFDYLPTNFTIIIPITILSISLYSYVNTELVDKTYSYIGFPSIWNIVVLYLAILDFDRWTNLLIIVSLIFLKFAPFKVFHPMRYPNFRKTNITLMFLVFLTSIMLLVDQMAIRYLHELYVYCFVIWLFVNLYFVLFVIFYNIKINIRSVVDD